MNNNAFVSDINDPCSMESNKDGKMNGVSNGHFHDHNGIENLESIQSIGPDQTCDSEPERESWGKGVEFLMSCIAMSVGLGNVWRFPFTALENGGGAFLFPYIIVLLVIGRPLYYLEMVIGQFSSRNSINVFDMVPAFRGIF